MRIGCHLMSLQDYLHQEEKTLLAIQYHLGSNLENHPRIERTERGMMGNLNIRNANRTL